MSTQLLSTLARIMLCVSLSKDSLCLLCNLKFEI